MKSTATRLVPGVTILQRPPNYFNNKPAQIELQSTSAQSQSTGPEPLTSVANQASVARQSVANQASVANQSVANQASVGSQSVANQASATHPFDSQSADATSRLKELAQSLGVVVYFTDFPRVRQLSTSVIFLKL